MPIYFKDIVETNSRLNLPLFLGINNRNKKVVVDMIDLPHLLVAGATGSGKSVALKTIIASLIFNKTPDELKLILIDKKLVELVAFENMPHLISPVITDNVALKGLYFDFKNTESNTVNLVAIKKQSNMLHS